MNRKEELLKIVCKDGSENEKILVQLVDEVVFLESQLVALKKLPFLKIHPDNPELQKATPASKQYKELLQQYTNCIKVLASASGQDQNVEDSPLRKWVKKYVDK